MRGRKSIVCIVKIIIEKEFSLMILTGTDTSFLYVSCTLSLRTVLSQIYDIQSNCEHV
jgi:hypothetical protein